MVDPPVGASERLLTLRAVLLGLAGVILVNLFTPYNNYVVLQTGLVCNSLSLSGVMLTLVMVLLINAPLLRWAPRHALRRYELATALAMILVGCAVPSVGLFRYLPGHLVGIFYWSAQRPELATLVDGLNLPDWLFPTFANKDAASRGAEPIVTQFYARVPLPADSSFMDRVGATPFGAWLIPLAAWGVFAGLGAGAILCLSVIFRRQWVENERLPFPIATVYGTLIEPPAAGQALNRLFRSRAFYVTIGIVFLLHLLSGANQYFPKVPAIPLSFDIKGLLADSEFWSRAQWYSTEQQIYFTVIGICYFVNTRVVLSLVVFCMLGNLATMSFSYAGKELSMPMKEDQIFGAASVALVTVLWIARKHLAAVLRQMIGRGRTNDPRGFYLPYALAGWGAVLCAAGMVVWLTLAGTSVAGAITIVLMMLGVMLLVGRIVAETGVLYVLIPLPHTQPFVYAAEAFETPVRSTTGSFFFARMFFNMFHHDTREALPNYSLTALRVMDESVQERRSRRRAAIAFVGALFGALVVAYVTSGASTLYCFYNYPGSLGTPSMVPLSDGQTVSMPQQALANTLTYIPPGTGDTAAHSRGVWFATGAAIASLLSVLNLRFANWPLPPVGYLLAYTWGVQMTWFSLLLGWLSKTILIRLGGASLYYSVQPVFLGLIVGEVAATAFWIGVGLVAAGMGVEYHSIQLLPR